MKKYFIFFVLLGMIITGIFFLDYSVSKSARSSSLTLISPSSCPADGCAAGQRLNLRLDFSIQPKVTTRTNTVVCFSSLNDGQSGAGTDPWADFSTGWVSSNGKFSNLPYTAMDVDDVCVSNLDPAENLVTAISTTFSSAMSDQIDLALRIHRNANLPGFVKGTVFELQEDNITWLQTGASSVNFNMIPLASPAYVGKDAAACGSLTPCYVTSGDDLPGGLGTGLKDAIDAFDTTAQLFILGNYNVKGNTVTVNKPHIISGFSEAAITYEGQDCYQPLIELTSGVTLDHLTVTDGTCTNVSRNLISVNSPQDVLIEYNDLTAGYEAISVSDNTGNITIRFNQINDNVSYAVKRSSGTNTGLLNIVANNILDNRIGVQVDCQNKGLADHNFWGASNNLASSVINCTTTPGKQLGASILPGSTGVDAVLAAVDEVKASYFNGKLAVNHIAGNDYNLYITNHGNGTESNIPFLDNGTDAITPCSNFYDIFLSGGAQPTDLILSLKYDLNSSCISLIESNSYCNQANSSLYPLWWYDPQNNVTLSWDTVGGPPAGPGASGATGQVTTCNMTNDEISVVMDASGRPGVINDLTFTPFVIGIPLPVGIKLDSFTGVFTTSRVDLKWITLSENKVDGFYVLRSESENGIYTRVTDLIPAIGDAFFGGVYKYSDFDIVFTRSYFYKIEVINEASETIEMHGPISVLTATATPTITPTRTITPTFTQTPYRSNTPYVYRSPTRFIPSITPTARIVTSIYKSPTPFSTSAVQTLPPGVTPTFTPYVGGLPISTELVPGGLTGTPSLMPPTESTTLPSATSGTEMAPVGTGSATAKPYETGATSSLNQLDEIDRHQRISWVAIVVGGLIGLGLLILVGLFLFKSRLS